MSDRIKIICCRGVTVSAKFKTYACVWTDFCTNIKQTFNDAHVNKYYTILFKYDFEIMTLKKQHITIFWHAGKCIV